MSGHVVFTDESQITASRFRSLSAFSMPVSSWSVVSEALRRILIESDVTEFKWNKIKDAKYFFCAEKYINFVLDNLRTHQLRVDILVWDTQDSRHKVIGRDDIANYERMFFHLLSNAMKRRARGSKWHIRPDERGGVDWVTSRDCLSRVGRRIKVEDTIFGRFFTDPAYFVSSFEQSKSHDELPIQVADLFSGLSVFSRENYVNYKKWESLATPSFFDGKDGLKLSNREEYRFRLLGEFRRKCRSRSLGVSLDAKQCLCTFDPSNPINFWHYEPQGDYDRAPKRSGSPR